MARFQVYLIKPTPYDDAGYPLQWWRSTAPSDLLACRYALDAPSGSWPRRGAVAVAGNDLPFEERVYSIAGEV